IKMPALPCMTAVMDLKVPFRAAANRECGPGQQPLSPFDAERTSVWFEEEVPKMLEQWPVEWAPRIGRQIVGDLG
ncbi:MAG TPA: hypothetical protein VMU78_08315, partial [Methylocella sp.]|nr:hypothetical protein [Methylocella sp.]